MNVEEKKEREKGSSMDSRCNCSRFNRRDEEQRDVSGTGGALEHVGGSVGRVRLPGMILQFALSTDDPYPSSNWIIVLHGLSVREARVSICAGGKYGWWNGSSFLLPHLNYISSWDYRYQVS